MANPLADLGLANLIVTPEVDPDVQPEQPPKKKKMTKDEKKEKKRQREIALKRTKMMREFQNELELSRRTAKKLQLNWRDTLSEMKITELKEEMSAWEQKTMRQLYEKDCHMRDMLTYMNLVEETNHAVHAQLTGYFDFMIDVHNALTKSCKKFYEEAAYEIFTAFQNELIESKDHNSFNRRNCENIMHTTNLIFENMLFNDYKIFMDIRNRNVNVEIEKRYCLRDSIVKKMMAAKQQLLDFVNEVTASPLDPKKHERIRKAMSRQRMLSSVTQALQEMGTKQKRQYNDLKLEFLQTELTTQKKINDLILERSYFKEIRKSIENNIKCNRKETLQKLAIVTGESYAVIKHYEKIRQYGEMLLSATANVRKYQTEAEKVVVWGDFPPLDENSSEIEDLRKFALTVISPSTHVDRSDEEFYNELNLMRVFHHRLLIAELHKEMLEREKRQLMAENKKYTDFICSLGHEKSKSTKGPNAIQIHSIIPTASNCAKK